MRAGLAPQPPQPLSYFNITAGLPIVLASGISHHARGVGRRPLPTGLSSEDLIASMALCRAKRISFTPSSMLTTI